MMKIEQDKSEGLVALEKWRRDVGVSRTTAWRWRRSGWLQTFYISGKVYVGLAEVTRFVAVAKSGRYAKQIHAPVRKPQRPEESATILRGNQ